MWKALACLSLVVVGLGATACSTTDAPAEPASVVNVAAPRTVGVSINAPTSLFRRGQTAQLAAIATLSNGFTEDRSASAQWQSSNGSVASVNAGGVVTAGDEGETTIRATLDGTTGTITLRVRYANRTNDPAPGQQIPLPGNVAALVQQFNNERPGLIDNSCPGGIKYRNNPWLDYIVDRLRETDTRWGYNAKPTRTAADNGGLPVIAAGDEIAYNYSADPDEGTTKVYLIDILESHCGSPRLTYRHFTGEEPGRWTGAGRF
ncbi:MAG: Ig-like domain-containing protein [Acidobacteria bacterium]|nr:Ig-like domain-containing protein [Acidobacteriota bacterium]